MGGVELLLTIVFVALCGYAWGAGKEDRERTKKKIAQYDREYNRDWEEWRVKYKAVQGKDGKWYPTINPDKDEPT